MSRRDQESPFRWIIAAALLCLAWCCGVQVQAGSLKVTVKQRDDKPLVGAVITLETPALPAASPIAAIMTR